MTFKEYTNLTLSSTSLSSPPPAALTQSARPESLRAPSVVLASLPAMARTVLFPSPSPLPPRKPYVF